ncbi:hypothetical protein [Saccharicrinis fermentans]|uniref:hypothetical protein n=1 Tax=Saccharicrinis fermentans TaxID=982 RepID=UPI0004BC8E17|nr:hypothetical protein [Saccharicrinis fermentans]
MIYEEIDEEENSTPEAAHTLEENSPEPEAKSDIKSMAQPRPKKTNSKQTK